MRNRVLGSLTALLAGAGLALAQPPARQSSTFLTSSRASETVIVSEGPVDHTGIPANGEIIQDGIVDQGIVPGDAGPGPWGNPSCECTPGCGPEGEYWASAEYLLWWMRNADLPPLATLGPAGSGGVLGTAGTSVLLGGNNDFDSQERHGFRVKAGAWFTQYQDIGIETSAFLLGSRSSNFSTLSRGGPGSGDLGVPFVDVSNGQALGFSSAFPIATAGLTAGSINANASSRLWGGEGNLILGCRCMGNARLDYLLGFRYLELNDGLGLTTDTSVLPNVPFIGGTNIIAHDQFSATNRFYGANFGLKWEWWSGRLFANAVGKVAFGGSHEIVNIRGTTYASGPGFGRQFAPAGLFAQATNIGRYSRSQFDFVPEIGLNVGYQLTHRMRGFIGYTFMYWTDVVRAGEQIDTGINTTQVPVLAGGALVGPGRPMFAFRDSDFWVHGLNAGLELRF